MKRSTNRPPRRVTRRATVCRKGLMVRALIDDLAGQGVVLNDADRALLDRLTCAHLSLIGRIASASWSDGFARGGKSP